MNNFGFTMEPDILKRKRELETLGKIRQLKERIVNIERSASVLYEDVEPYTGPKVVVYGGTEACYKDMERSAKMLLANSHIDKIYFLIDTDKFPTALPDIIECINVSDQVYYPKWSPNYMYPVSYMTMMRHTLYDMFPQYDRVLWLDGDTLIMDDISQLFYTPLGNFYYFAAAEENRHYLKYTSNRKIEYTQAAYHDFCFEPSTYFNAAVLLINTKLLREDGMGEQLVNRLNNYLIYYSDQTLINEMCRDRIYSLDFKWNTSHATEDAKMPKIIHMSSGDLTLYSQNAIETFDKITFNEVMDLREKRKKVGILNGKE